MYESLKSQREFCMYTWMFETETVTEHGHKALNCSKQNRGTGQLERRQVSVLYCGSGKRDYDVRNVVEYRNGVQPTLLI
jgi:hypothetical protein